MWIAKVRILGVLAVSMVYVLHVIKVQVMNWPIVNAYASLDIISSNSTVYPTRWDHTYKDYFPRIQHIVKT